MSLDQRPARRTARPPTSTRPPIPDLTSLVDGGRRRKRRRDVRRVAVAAACLAVVGAVPFVAGTLRTAATRPRRSASADRVARRDRPAGRRPARHPVLPGNGTDRRSRRTGPGRVRRADPPRPVDGLPRPARRQPARRRPAHPARPPRLEQLVPRRQPGRPLGRLGDRDARPRRAAPRLRPPTGEQVAEEPWPTSEGWVAGIDDLGRVYFQSYGTTGRRPGLRPAHRGRLQVRGVPTHPSPSIKFVTADGFGIYPYDSPQKQRPRRSSSARSPPTARSPSSARSTRTGALLARPVARRHEDAAGWSSARRRDRQRRPAAAPDARRARVVPGLGVARDGAGPVRPGRPRQAAHRQRRLRVPGAAHLVAPVRRRGRDVRGRTAAGWTDGVGRPIYR